MRASWVPPGGQFSCAVDRRSRRQPRWRRRCLHPVTLGQSRRVQVPGGEQGIVLAEHETYALIEYAAGIADVAAVLVVPTRRLGVAGHGRRVPGGRLPNAVAVPHTRDPTSVALIAAASSPQFGQGVGSAHVQSLCRLVPEPSGSTVLCRSLAGRAGTRPRRDPAADERPKLRRHNEEVHVTVLVGLPADHEAAVHVWHAANAARLLPPSVDRVARIWEKLAEPEACLVIGHLDAARDVVAMALAEPGRAERGAGAVIPGYGHVSMVFVHPDVWGRGVGGQLLQGLHERASERGWNRTTLWTRASNARARRLYEGQGYRRSGHETTLGSGDSVLQLERQAS